MTARKPRVRKAAPRARAEAPAEPVSALETPRASTSFDFGQSLVEAFLTGERINQVLLDLIEPRLWRIFPPSSSRRNIATSFAHIHNVRCMRLRMSDKSAEPPERLERATISMDEARLALGASARAMASLIQRSVAEGGRVHDFRPDVVLMTCGAMAHEAHHRGQVCHWLRELGAPLSPESQLRLWEWDKRWKEVAKR